MHRTIAAGLVLAFTFSALGGAALAQSEPTSDPSTSEEATASTSLADTTLPFIDPEWRRITPANGPAAREDHTWTVDGEGRFAYLFGGRAGDKEFADLWRYDLVADTWTRLRPKGKTPAPRFGHSAVWVDGHGVVIFAGQRGPDFFDDLWVFDPGTRKWRQLPSRGQVPKRRYGSCMVVGPDGRLWISHGFTSAGRFEDTRAYNLKSERWAVLTPAGRVPDERCLHECFTSAAGELVLYGGQDDGAFALGDLWVMDRERSWERRDDPEPRPRRLYGVTEAGAYAYIFGGAGEDNSAFDDLWRVDRETLDYQRVRVEGRAPVARYAGTLITDPARGRLLLFGGQAAQAKADVWELVDRAEPPDELEAAPRDEPESNPTEPPSAEELDPDET